MSLLQEMETYGLADCEFNRKILAEENKIKKVLQLCECIENHLIIVHAADSKELKKLARKEIKKLENEIKKLTGFL